MTIFFPDISGYQTGFPLTGIPAIFVKATEGVGYTNPDHARVARDAQARGLLRVSYHFLRRAAAGSTGAQQAVYAHSVIGSGVPTMLDVEPAQDGIGPTLADVFDFTRQYRALGGVLHLAYLPRWYWLDLGSPDLRPLEAAGLHIVSSLYTTYSDTGPGWASYGGVAPAIWQYTDAARLDNGYTVDMNAYRGSVDELRALVTGDDTMGVWDTEPGSSIAFTLLNGAIGGPQHVRDALLRRAVDAGFAAVQTALTGERAAIDALSKALVAGGGSVDAAAVNAHIDAKVADVVTAVSDLHDELATARARIEELEAALQAGADATSHALDAVPSPPPAPPAG